jgi:hypothetical protein
VGKIQSLSNRDRTRNKLSSRKGLKTPNIGDGGLLSAFAVRKVNNAKHPLLWILASVALWCSFRAAIHANINEASGLSNIIIKVEHAFLL